MCLTYVEGGVFLLHMIIDVGNPQGLHWRGANSQKDLGSDQQQVHHVGVGLQGAKSVLLERLATVGANVPTQVSPLDFHYLVLVSQKLGQSGQKSAEGHDDAAAADQTRPMRFGPEVADKQDQRQVAYLKAAGDHADIGALQVEPSLQGGQHAHLKATRPRNQSMNRKEESKLYSN